MQRAHSIITASAEPDISAARELFLEYAASLGFSLCFQGFDQELEALPGCYAPPDGVLLLARAADGSAAGCVAARRIAADTSEMKRLFVRPAHRGAGLGRELAVAVIDASRKIGYHRMRLDTLSTMHAALALYRELGFIEIEPYYDNPICGAVYLELAL